MNDLHSFVLLVSCSVTEWWLGLHYAWDLLLGSTDRKSNRFGMSQGNYFQFTTITLITLLTVILVLCRHLGKLKYKFEQEK